MTSIDHIYFLKNAIKEYHILIERAEPRERFRDLAGQRSSEVKEPVNFAINFRRHCCRRGSFIVVVMADGIWFNRLDYRFSDH